MPPLPPGGDIKQHVAVIEKTAGTVILILYKVEILT
jgi:hypothetical protein